MTEKFLVLLCGLHYPAVLELESYFEEEPYIVLHPLEQKYVGKNTIFYEDNGLFAAADLVVINKKTNEVVFNEKQCKEFRKTYFMITDKTEVDNIKEEISNKFVEWLEWTHDYLE